MGLSVKIDVQRDPNVLYVILGVSVVVLLIVLCILFNIVELISLIVTLSFGGMLLYCKVGGTLTAADDGVVLNIPMHRPTVIPYHKIKDVSLDVENRGRIVTGLYKGSMKYAHSISIVTNEGTYTYSCLKEHTIDPTFYYAGHEVLNESSPFAAIGQQIRTKSNI